MVFLSSSDRGFLVQSTALSTTRDSICFRATRTLLPPDNWPLQAPRSWGLSQLWGCSQAISPPWKISS